MLVSEQFCQVGHLVFSSILQSSISCHMKSAVSQMENTAGLGFYTMSERELSHRQKVLKPMFWTELPPLRAGSLILQIVKDEEVG